MVINKVSGNGLVRDDRAPGLLGVKIEPVLLDELWTGGRKAVHAKG